MFDEDDEFAEGTLEQPSNPEPPEGEDEGDLTTEVLKAKGISDPDKIKFEDESGAVVERAWDTLSREEQLNILTDTTEETENNDLDDEEIDLINQIRSSGMSVNDYMQSLMPKPEEPVYEVDTMTDDEVYALDLLNKVGKDNITDDELTAAVEAAKQNEALFKKQVEGLRNEYVQLQKDQEAQQANEAAHQREAAFANYATSIRNEIEGFNSFAGKELELSNDDIEQLASFMIDRDNQGVTALGRALNDPKLLTKAAFWLLNEDTIAEELSKQLQDSYKRGYEAGNQDKPAPVVFGPKKETKQDDFNFDDEDW